MKELSGEIPYVIVGNKSDLARTVDKGKAQQKADDFGVEYIETSAKLDENVDEAFKTLSIKILNNLKL